MMAEFERKGKQKVDVRFENTSIPCIIEENFEPYYSENSVNSIEDVLQDQVQLECMLVVKVLVMPHGSISKSSCLCELTHNSLVFGYIFYNYGINR